jgi:hypothetical protein
MKGMTTLKNLVVAALAALAVLALPSLAAARDRNHDRIPDRWEKRHHLSLHVKQARRDQDRDHLRNRAEFMAGDNPRDPDSDNDGIEDGDENAGTIQSFDAETGRLTIDLFGGDTISGLVTDETEIKCEGEHTHSATTSNEGGDNPESGDDQTGEDQPGEDEHGEDQSGEPSDGQPGGDDSGSEHSDEGHGDGECGGNCTTADLVEGAVVEEAELKVENGQATFEEVELAG